MIRWAFVAAGLLMAWISRYLEKSAPPMPNYPHSNVLGEANKSRRRLNCLTFAALVGFALALALLIWGD